VRTVLVLSLAFAGCHEVAPSPAPLASAPQVKGPSGPTSQAQGPAGEVVVPDDARGTGRFLLTWRTAEEEREVAGGGLSLAVIRRMLDRMTVSAADVDLAVTRRIPYALPNAPRDAVPIAIVDVEHTFWATFQGGGRGYMATGASGGGALRLVRAKANPEPRPERCQGERYQLVVVEDANLGRRRFCAYLPASSKADPKRRYPVVLLLPGFGSSEMSYLTGRRHAGERLDDISKETKREAVLVGVDTSVPLGSTYLEDSPVVGAWDTFMATRVLHALERALPILPRRTARALMGQSTGGYNALSFGMRHTELYAAIGASSPDAPDVERWLFSPGTRRVKDWIRNWGKIELAVGGAGQFTSWAASWSPDSAAPGGFRYPFDVETGQVDETVLAQWVARTPHGFLRDPKALARIKGALSGRILITVGRRDDFELFGPAESFAKELEDLGVETRFLPTDQGHAGYLERFEPTFRFLLEKLDAPSPSTVDAEAGERRPAGR
jgi:pimeloyl-ACP methyl ester carboxylesterase